MSNLGPQFATKDWNPFLAAYNLIDKLAQRDNSQYRSSMAMIAAQNRLRETAANPEEKPVTPTPTYKPVAQHEEPQMTSATVQPIKTMQPTAPTATHPITGEKVAKVPVKPRGKKPTAPGTKPKKK